MMQDDGPGAIWKDDPFGRQSALLSFFFRTKRQWYTFLKEPEEIETLGWAEKIWLQYSGEKKGQTMFFFVLCLPALTRSRSSI
jgi:hypothetical protein